MRSKKRADFLRCVGEKMLAYGLGRGLEDYDRPAVQKDATDVEKSGAAFNTLILQVVKSVPFQKRRGEGNHRDFAKSAEEKK